MRFNGWRKAGPSGMVVLMALLSGCAAVVAPNATSRAETSAERTEQLALAEAWTGEGAAGSGWAPQVFPGKTPSQYRYARLDARNVVSAQADSSMSVLRRKLRVEAGDLRPMVFSWKVPALIESADLAVREHDDSPARIILVFDGDRSRFSDNDRALSDLSRLLTGEDMPYATLMYVWCNRRAPGTVVINPRTPRVRSIVVESGPGHLNQWRQYRRDVRADFVKAFGEEPHALIGMGLMTDADNTRSRAQAWYGPISFDEALASPLPQ